MASPIYLSSEQLPAGEIARIFHTKNAVPELFGALQHRADRSDLGRALEPEDA
jgi:hypothetical protein